MMMARGANPAAFDPKVRDAIKRQRENCPIGGKTSKRIEIKAGQPGFFAALKQVAKHGKEKVQTPEQERRDTDLS